MKIKPLTNCPSHFHNKAYPKTSFEALVQWQDLIHTEEVQLDKEIHLRNNVKPMPSEVQNFINELSVSLEQIVLEKGGTPQTILRSKFLSWDVDRSGLLDSSELTSALNTLGLHNKYSAHTVNSVVKYFDANNCGEMAYTPLVNEIMKRSNHWLLHPTSSEGKRKTLLIGRTISRNSGVSFNNEFVGGIYNASGMYGSTDVINNSPFYRQVGEMDRLPAGRKSVFNHGVKFGIEGGGKGDAIEWPKGVQPKIGERIVKDRVGIYRNDFEFEFDGRTERPVSVVEEFKQTVGLERDDAIEPTPLKTSEVLPLVEVSLPSIPLPRAKVKLTKETRKIKLLALLHNSDGSGKVNRLSTRVDQSDLGFQSVRYKPPTTRQVDSGVKQKSSIITVRLLRKRLDDERVRRKVIEEGRR